MNVEALAKTARVMVGEGKGLLAMDESNGTCNQRFASLGVAQTPLARRDWRELILSTPGLGEYIGGVILYDETIRQARADGTPFVELLAAAGILIGIKVDLGAKELAAHPGEKVTEGLDGLRERLASYFELGARFAKWRAVIKIGAANQALPSPACIEANAHALARYAALCQAAGLVPIVEPEVLMEGGHTLQRCAEVTEAVLRRVFAQIADQSVVLEAMILKPNMVLAGSAGLDTHSAAEVADATVQCLLRSVPAAVPGIAFLSGGQSGEMASVRLNAMHIRSGASASPGARALPWPLTFSFARAIQYPALEIWAGRAAHRESAQRALLHRTRCNHAALRGHYDAAMESA
jgi:fructose-bisphosphate aldolase class I